MFESQTLEPSQGSIKASVMIYDVETCCLVKAEGQPQGFRYADSWADYIGMGVSVVAAYSYLTDSYHVFMKDNLHELQNLADEHSVVVGFNSMRFDDQLLKAHGVEVMTTFDLMREIQAAAKHLPWPKGSGRRAYSLSAMARANELRDKTGSGADAPMLFQRGRIGELVSYCVQDVAITKQLFDRRERLKCPHTGLQFSLKGPL